MVRSRVMRRSYRGDKVKRLSSLPSLIILIGTLEVINDLGTRPVLFVQGITHKSNENNGYDDNNKNFLYNIPAEVPIDFLPSKRHCLATLNCQSRLLLTFIILKDPTPFIFIITEVR